MPASHVLTNADILALINANLAHGLVIDKIRHEESRFDVDAASLITLKKAGVTDDIIDAMVQAVQANEQQRNDPSVTRH